MRKRLSLLAVISAAALVVAACSGQTPTSPSTSFGDTSFSTEGKMVKVNICHVTGDGSYNLLNINGNALGGHVGHGDIYPVPEDGCPGIACAIFSGLSVSGSAPFITVSWTDTVNTSDYYIVEGLLPSGDWDPVSSEVYSEPDGDYAFTGFVLPFITTFRVVSSCGVTSDPVSTTP